MRALNWRGWIARLASIATPDAEAFLSRHRRFPNGGPVSHPAVGDLYDRRDMIAAYHSGKRCTVGPDEGVAFAIREATILASKRSAGRHKRITLTLSAEGIEVCGYAGQRASALHVPWRQIFDGPGYLLEAVERINEATDARWRGALNEKIGSVNPNWEGTLK